MKPIRLTDSALAIAKKEILNKLNNTKLQSSKINFTYDLTEIMKTQLENSDIKKPIVYMTAATYLKMLEYILVCPTEIAWHGTVKRGEADKKHIFYIKDVYLYPQKIAAATVQVDDDKYTKWSDAQDADTFNNRRFQGHSHVNMGVTYSGTDENNKNEFLQDLLDDDYYIFVVANKRQEMNWEVYDLSQNIIFENKDIDFRIYIDKDKVLDNVQAEINEYCTKPTYNYNAWEHLDRKPESFPNTTGFKDYVQQSYPYTYSSSHLKPHTTAKNTQKPKYKVEKPTKVSRWVVLMNREGRNFEKEYPEYEGATQNVRFNGLDYNVFVPHIPLTELECNCLRKDGWHVRKMPITETNMEEYL